MLYNEALNIHIEYLNSTFYPPSSFLRAALKFSLLQFLFINYSIRFEILEFPKKKERFSPSNFFLSDPFNLFLKQDFQEFSRDSFYFRKKKTKEKDNTKIKISSISSLENVLHFTKRKISPVEKRTIEKKRWKKKKKMSDRLISGASSKRYGQCAGWQWRNAGRKILFLRFLLVPSVGQIALEVGWGRGYVTVLGGRDDAPQRPSIEHQHRGASLQSRVSTLTLPVTIARFAQGNVPIRVVVAQGCRTR